MNLTLSSEKIELIEWYRNGIAIKPTKKHEVMFNPAKGSCTFVLKNVGKQDSGEYVCKVVSQNGKFTSKCVVNVDQGKGILFFANNYIAVC